MIGLYWGRFNPPHKGHIKLIKKLLKSFDTLIIAIGSAQYKNTKRNPFDGKERSAMIKSYLKEEEIDIKKIKIIPIPNGKTYFSSVKNIFDFCPKFDVMITDKETIIKLVKNRVNVKRIKRIGSISSTQIRNAIAEDKKWKHLTGKSVAETIERKKGFERIKKAYERT